MIGSAIRAIAILSVFGLLAGCESTPGIGSIRDTTATSAVNVDPTPRLQAGDRVRITVFGEDKLSGDFEIDSGGDLSLPLAGTIKAAGFTKAELERELTRKYRGNYLRDPKVTVDVASFRPFYVLGEVQKPGEYTYKPGLNVLTAMALAGGQTYRASNSQVLIQRSGETAMKEYPLSPAVPVYPGDLLRVPERYF
jgi:polysaccharide export outer membrane protein